jgi:hypothetical protein
LGTQIVFRDYSIIDDGQGANAGEHKVLCDFVPQSFETNQEDVGPPQSDRQLENEYLY